MNREEKIKLAIKSGFTYNPETGEILSRFGKKPIEKKSGYVLIRLNLNKKRYYLLGHHFAWYMVYGVVDEDKVIDHINHIKNDNRICNLRVVNSSQNSFNRSKIKGYTFNKSCNKWQSKIVVNGTYIYLGIFDDKMDAKKSYFEAKKIYHNI